MVAFCARVFGGGGDGAGLVEPALELRNLVLEGGEGCGARFVGLADVVVDAFEGVDVVFDREVGDGVTEEFVWFFVEEDHG